MSISACWMLPARDRPPLVSRGFAVSGGSRVRAVLAWIFMFYMYCLCGLFPTRAFGARALVRV